MIIQKHYLRSMQIKFQISPPHHLYLSTSAYAPRLVRKIQVTLAMKPPPPISAYRPPTSLRPPTSRGLSAGSRSLFFSQANLGDLYEHILCLHTIKPA